MKCLCLLKLYNHNYRSFNYFIALWSLYTLRTAAKFSEAKLKLSSFPSAAYRF